MGRIKPFPDMPSGYLLKYPTINHVASVGVEVEGIVGVSTTTSSRREHDSNSTFPFSSCNADIGSSLCKDADE